MKISVSVVRKSTQVTLEDEQGNEVLFSLKEMTGAQRDEYFNKVQARAKLDENGNLTGIREYRGVFSSLLSYTLYDAEGKLVPEDRIQSWPDSAQRVLFEEAQRLNGMSRDEGDEKN